METGWLIEKHFDGVLAYLSIDLGMFYYTSDPSTALRFARRIDAERFFDVLLVFDDYHEGAAIVEHSWV